MTFFTIIYQKIAKNGKKVTNKEKFIFELNCRPENAKEMQKTLFNLSGLDSFLVFKREIRRFD